MAELTVSATASVVSVTSMLVVDVVEMSVVSVELVSEDDELSSEELPESTLVLGTEELE